MALTLVKETGLGLATANAYTDRAGAQSYHERTPYLDEWEAIDAEKQDILLVWATSILDALDDGNRTYRWYGTRTYPTVQALMWPRSGVYNAAGDDDISSSTIPQVLIDATAELARRLNVRDRVEDSENRAVVGSTTGRGGKTVNVFDTRYKSIIPPSVMILIRPYIDATERMQRC